MLNSKMKRSMAWIMSAAVIMSAAPVSAADFTAEADVEVTAEAADAGAEENTDAPEAEAEEDGGFGSGEMIFEENTAEAGSDETGLTDEENAGDESADFMDGFSDGSAEEESADVSDGFTDEGMSTEDLLQAFADGATNTEAPHSSVESLPVGKYENATVNLYVPGSLNKVLPGVNAYLTNSTNPMGLENAPFGTPTDPVFNNATLEVLENGKIEVTVDVMNPAFELIHVKDGSNIHVKEIKRKDSYYIDNELADKVKMEDGTYQGRITQLTLELDDFSGLYTLGDCVEFALPTYNESTPDVDQRWTIPLDLAIDFEELQSGDAYTTKTWFNENANLGLAARGRNLENVTGGVEEITSGDEYNKIQEYLSVHASKNCKFRVFNINLKDEKGNQLDINKYRVRFVGSVAFPPEKKPVYYQWKDGKLSPRMKSGATIREFDNGDEVDDPFDAVVSFSGWTYGYVVVCTGNSNVTYEKIFSDNVTGLEAIWYSDDTNAYDDNASATVDTDSYKIETYFSAIFQKNMKLDDKALNEFMNSNIQSEYKKILVTGTYGAAIYSKIAGTDDSVSYDLAPSGKRNVSHMDLVLPLNDVAGKDIYKVTYNKKTGEYLAAEKVTYTEQGGKAVINAIDKSLTLGKQYKQWLKYYLSVTDENVLDTKESVDNNAEFFVSVTEGAIAEKPTAPTSEYTYDGTEKTAVPSSEYYTVSGDVSKTLPGTYHVTVTLKDGYAWTDGTTDPVEFDWTIKALQTEKPVAISGLTYNGESQTGVKAGTGYNLAGTYTAKDAGTYNAKVLLADGYEWSDGTNDALTLTWSIAKKAVAKPVAAKALVYNGKSQTGVTAGEGYTVTGNTQTDAGDYTAVAALDKNYAWADGTTDSAKVAWSIAKKAVAKPSAAANLVYTGSEQTSVTAGEGYIVTGNTQTNAGTYAAVATLDKNHAWTDGTTAPATVQWTIAKAAQNVTAKTASKSYKIATVKKKSQSFTIGAAADGTLTYKVTATPSKKAAKYLTVTKNGKVTVKKGAPAGTYTITVSAAETANNQAASKEITIKVNKTSQKVSAKVSSKTIKSKQIAKKNYAFTIGAKGKGKLTYKVTSTPKNSAKYISVNKNGKVIVKKKAPKGTYKITVTAAGNATYAKATKTITVKVK